MRDLVMEVMPGAIIYPTASRQIGLSVDDPEDDLSSIPVIGPDSLHGEVTITYPDAQSLVNRLRVSYPAAKQRGGG